ncbi:Mur ligase [Halenospora varia]|nr:Mur ligase [Halenospora varia]
MSTFLRLPASLRYAIATTILPLPQPTTTRWLRCFSSTTCRRTAAVNRSHQKTYRHALKLLATLQSNRAIRTDLADKKDSDDYAIPEMLEWARKAGYAPLDFAPVNGREGLRCIHVAGTTGKGSVCAMVERMLMVYRERFIEERNGGARGIGKIGLYTSPHLVTVRERIRLDGAPVSKELFTRYFFELWERFEASAKARTTEGDPTHPGYFRFLTLLAFHTFLREGVKTAIVECGIGGRYDSTNILPPEAVAVSAITKLELDHTDMLGNTIEEIAWHKAGIIKSGVPVFTMEMGQTLEVIGREARKQNEGSDLRPTSVVRLPALDQENVEMGLKGGFQKDNASLAVAVVGNYLHQLGQDITLSNNNLPEPIQKALAIVSVPGRHQVVSENNIIWHLDGAHTPASIAAVATWFADIMTTEFSSPNPPSSTMLIFNQDDSGGRKGSDFLKAMFDVLDKRLKVNPCFSSNWFTFAAFCTNDPYAKAKSPSIPLDRWETRPEQQRFVQQEKLANAYRSLESNTLYEVYGNVEEAVKLARRIAVQEEGRLLVLVTGSLKLVGGVLTVLGGREGLEEIL